MNVLMIVPQYFPFDRPRVGAYYHEHALALSYVGAKVTVINVDLRPIHTIMNGELLHYNFKRSVENSEGITVWKFKGWAIPKNPRINEWLWEKFAMRVALLYVRQFGVPDIIHAQRSLLAGSAAMNLSKKLGVPYVVTERSSAFLRNTLQGWQQAKIHAVMTDASGISALSNSLARAIAKYIGNSAVSLIPNVVRFDKFPLYKEKNINHYNYLTVSNLNQNKNTQSIIEAFAERFAGKQQITLSIGGNGSEMTRLNAIVDEKGIHAQVKFLGLLTQGGVSEAMSKANCFVLASHHETFGAVIIEAMATGLPVIATASGGPEDIVSRETGYVVPVNNVAALGASMERVYYERANWETLGPSIRSYAKHRFSQKAVGESMLEFYHKSLKLLDKG